MAEPPVDVRRMRRTGMSTSPAQVAENRRDFDRFQRGMEHEARYMRGRFLRALRAKHYAAVSLALWATADGLPSDYWDARVDAFAQLIEEVERYDRDWWWC